MIGHFTQQCRPRGAASLKQPQDRAASPQQPQDHLETQHISVMHNTVTMNIVRQEPQVWRPTRKQLNTWKQKRINATLRNKEFDHSLNKYVEMKPAVGPKIQVSIIQTDGGIDRLEAIKFGVKYIPPLKEEKIIAVDQIPMQANKAVKLVSDGTDQQISI